MESAIATVEVMEQNLEYVKEFIGNDKWNAYQNSKTKSKTILSAQEKRAKFIVENMLSAMSKYEEPWWISSDMQKICYRQMNERILLISFEKFKKAVAFVLGRDVVAEEYLDLLPYKDEINRRFKS